MTAFHTAMFGRRGRTALRLVAAAGLATMLAGCYQTQVAQAPEVPTDYRLRHPITLRDGEHTVQVFLGRNRGGLNPAQRADVLAFAQLWKREATSGIVVAVPQGGPTDRAAADSMREVHSIFAAAGVPRNAVYVRSYRPSPTALSSINISYSKLSAQAGPCGQWPADLGPSQSADYNKNTPYWNLGCATQRNLAAMVDNPADLVQPRGETPPYSGRRAVAIDKYRRGEVPSGSYPNDSAHGYNTGKVSDVGK